MVEETKQPVEKAEKAEKAPQEKKRRRPGQRRRRATSRRHTQNKAKIVADKQYTLREAVTLVKESKNAKFDETVEVVFKLGIDTRKSDQMLRGSIPLPKGIGKQVKVLVITEGDQVKEALAAGADFAGGKEMVDKIEQENWLDFDIVIAYPGMMKFVGRIGKVLGPKGKMPTPKSGTVTADVVSAVREFKSGRVEYRTDTGGNIHAPVGKKSFSVEDLSTNINAFIEHIAAARPATAKGAFIQKIVLSSTMGPGVPVEVKV